MAEYNENMKLWVEALRSGEYSQTQERLRSETGFCCLGVACDVYAKATGNGNWDSNLGLQTQVFNIEKEGKPEREFSFLPDSVAKWYGIKMNGKFDIKFLSLEEPISLIDLNDNSNYTFLDIATFIETKTERLASYE